MNQGNEPQTIDDLIVLGRGAPDQMQDGRVAVCVAGFSPSRGFVRIYPAPLKSPFQKWNIVSVPVERNAKDTRKESWKIQGSKGDWKQLTDKIKVVGKLDRPDGIALVPKLVSGCVNDLDGTYQSLGIIRPTITGKELSRRLDVETKIQKTLWRGQLPKTKVNYKDVPRLQYRCSDCKSGHGHDQQIIDMGCYEWFRKNPGKENQIFENYRIDDSEYEKFFLVGNQARYRSSYLIVSVIWWKKTVKTS